MTASAGIIVGLILSCIVSVAVVWGAVIRHRAACARYHALSVEHRALDCALATLSARAAERTLAVGDATEVALARARALNTKFIRTLAHDLRAPVRTMCNFSEVLLEATTSRDEERSVDYAQRVQRGARQLDEMITELKAFADATNGNDIVERWPIRRIVSTTLSRLEQQIAERDAKVTMRIDNCEDTLVPASIARVLQNLIDNALKYTDEPPCVDVTVRAGGGDWASPSSTACHSWIHISVVDAGMGFDPGDKDSVFGMFKQLHPHSAYAQGGLGMGLATCREIVEHNGGEISAASDGAGKGSAFRFTIPIAAEP